MVSSISSIKDQIDIVDFISSYASLKRKGGLYWTTCIFHEEKTPSFSVNKDRKYFHCFGCGQHGDIFTFIQKYKNFSFREAILFICDRYKIPVPFLTERKEENMLLELMETATNVFHETLMDSESIDYLTNRNIYESSIIKFRLGLCNGEAIKKIMLMGNKLEDLLDAGLINENGMSIFNNRIVFPITNNRGQVIAFSGRTLENKQPKYINSRESIIFSKSCTLFNLGNTNPKDNYCVMAEGYFDVIGLVQMNVNAVGSMGTALSVEQLTYISSKFTNIISMFDGDTAGVNASINYAKMCLQHYSSENNYYVCMLNKEDPHSLIQIGGEEAVKHILTKKQDIIYFLWDILEKNFNIQSNIQQYFALKKSTEQYLGLIKHAALKQIVTGIWDSKLHILKKRLIRRGGLHKNHMIPNINTHPESILMGLIIYKKDFLEEFLEEIVQFEFKKKIFNEILQNVLICFQENGEILEDIHNKYAEETGFLVNNEIVKFLGENPSLYRPFMHEFLACSHEKPDNMEKSMGINRFFIEIP